MPIPIICAGCRQLFQAPDADAGTTVACSHCQRPVSVPASAPPLAAPVGITEAPAPRPRDRADEDVPPSRAAIPLPPGLPREAHALGPPHESLRVGASSPADRAGRYASWQDVWGLVWGTWYRGVVLVVSLGFLVYGEGLYRLLGGLVVLVCLGVVGHTLWKWVSPWWGNRGSTLWVCPGGLIWVFDGNLHHCTWAEILSFQEQRTSILREREGGYYHGTAEKVDEVHTFSLRLPGGAYFQVEAARAQQFIRRKVLETNLPTILARLEQGEPVVLAPFTLSSAGLTWRSEFQPWEQLGDMAMERDALSVTFRDESEWCSEPAILVDHPTLLLAAVNHVLACEHRKHPVRDEPEPEANPFAF